ncbi:PKD repeat-containing protein [Amycolatopsis xylanica]|uniref:PKD repeat-containing protein n=1 Tax=Amycolatopsis xylanica TaxID=589385 RepID=A0A1H3PCE7_9PSEU|nr:PKD domain-containing protein [Amycolatopsis xylanica]SDY98757.1 PKD repeat-containing protein [Amycolatopsis xylanica]
MKLPLPRGLRTAAGIMGAVTLVAGLVAGADTRDVAPQVRLHSGAAWVASGSVGQLTLLDGTSAEVAAQVQVDQPGSVLTAVQDGLTGYVLNRTRDSLVRVDGATRERTQPAPVTAGAGASLSVFPTADAVYTLDTQSGMFTKSDAKTLQPLGGVPLNVRAVPDEPVMDADNRLWVLDEQTGDLVWHYGGNRHSRAQAHTPGSAHLTLTGGHPAIVDTARRTAELLDTDGKVTKSLPVDLAPGETVAVSGSSGEARLLISDSARGQLLVCGFDAGSCAPIPLSGPGDLGRAVEIGNRVVVPDYATGKAFIVDLAQRRLLAERQLFNRPVRFELLSRDGMVFYNDPLSDQAGILSGEGGVRPISKYNPAKPEEGTTPVPGIGDPGPLPTTGGDPGTGPVPPTGPQPGPDTATAVSIEISPRDHGMVGDEFQLTARGTGAVGVSGAQWTFGDGATATGTGVKHRWSQAGTFTVNVSAQLSTGQTGRAAAQVVIDSADAPPRIVKLVVTPEVPQVGRAATISAELTGGRYSGLAWSVTGAGGEVVTSTAPEFQHVFAAEGTYTVKLAVTGGATTVEQSREVTVAPAPHEVRCGDKVTTNAVLTADLICSTGVGVTIAASDVTLDLNGHTLSTDSTSAARKGIVVTGGSKVTIRNGTVRQFADGIVVADAADVTIDHVTARGLAQDNFDHFAITAERTRNLQIRNSTMDAFSPFRFDHGSSVTAVGSNLTGSDSYHAISHCGDNSSCVFQDGLLKVKNFTCDQQGSSVTADRMTVAIDIFAPGCKIATVTNSTLALGESSADDNVLTNNTFDGSRVLMMSWKHFTISGNVFRDADNRALEITDSAWGKLSGNHFLGAKASGVIVNFGWVGAPGTTVEISDNEFAGNGFGTGDETYGHDGLTVVDIKDNQVIVVVKGNHTKNNARFGINVNPGTAVVDGGGNTTSGDPQGCRGVVCGRG